MKKYILSAASFLIYLFNPNVAVVLAQTPTPNVTPVNINTCPGGTFGPLCINAEQSGTIIGNLFNTLVIVAVLIATVYLIYGGVKWVMSRGDKTEVEAARNHIVAAIVGLIVVFLAFFVINIVLKMFGISGTSFTIPSLLTPTSK